MRLAAAAVVMARFLDNLLAITRQLSAPAHLPDWRIAGIGARARPRQVRVLLKSCNCFEGGARRAEGH